MRRVVTDKLLWWIAVAVQGALAAVLSRRRK